VSLPQDIAWRHLVSLEDVTPNQAFVDWGRGSRPVVGVSWFDAQHFVG
jgi:hypothetical protein